MSSFASIASNKSNESVLSQISRKIEEKYPNLSAIDESVVNEVELTPEKQDEETIKMFTIISDGIENTVVKDEQDIFLELMALIKKYGGWVGAALILSINAYLATTDATIQGLITKLPGMLSTILSNVDIFGIAQKTGVITVQILLVRAVICYLSAAGNNAVKDIDSMKANILNTLQALNNINDKSIKLRNAKLQRTEFNLTEKINSLVKFNYLGKLQQIVSVPSLYFRINGGRIYAKIYNFVQGSIDNIKQVLEQMNDDSSDSFSIGSSKERVEVLQEIKSINKTIIERNREKDPDDDNEKKINIDPIINKDLNITLENNIVISEIISENISDEQKRETSIRAKNTPVMFYGETAISANSIEEIRKIINDKIEDIVKSSTNEGIPGPESQLSNSQPNSQPNSQTHVGGSKKSSKNSKNAKKTSKRSKKNTKRAKKSNKHTKKH